MKGGAEWIICAIVTVNGIFLEELKSVDTHDIHPWALIFK